MIFKYGFSGRVGRSILYKRLPAHRHGSAAGDANVGNRPELSSVKLIAPIAICRKFDIQTARRPRSRACFKAGSSQAASSRMTAITTRSSIKVKPVALPARTILSSYDPRPPNEDRQYLTVSGFSLIIFSRISAHIRTRKNRRGWDNCLAFLATDSVHSDSDRLRWNTVGRTN